METGAISFESLKEQLQVAVQNQVNKGNISDPSGFILLDGFINFPIYEEVSGTIEVGGSIIPAIGVVCKSSGLIHTFALKVLLPDIQI